MMFPSPHPILCSHQRSQGQCQQSEASPPSISVVSPSRSLGGDVASDGDFLIFEGNRYSRKGFLFKSFAMSAVVRAGAACVSPQNLSPRAGTVSQAASVSDSPSLLA